MQCQSCHGSMLDVGVARPRTGWLDEPACQSCHTGTAVHNNGQIRYTSVFEDSGQPRVAVDSTFATTMDVPCPGSPSIASPPATAACTARPVTAPRTPSFRARTATTTSRASQHQGHVGMLSRVRGCHGTARAPSTAGRTACTRSASSWVRSTRMPPSRRRFRSAAPATAATIAAPCCRASQADRTLSTDFGSKHFWRGFQIGCYTCHLGPSSERANPNRAPAVADTSASTTSGTPVEHRAGRQRRRRRRR